MGFIKRSSIYLCWWIATFAVTIIVTGIALEIGNELASGTPVVF